MEVRKLLGVELDRQAEAPRRLEDAADLRRGKADVLAKAVDRVGQPGGGDGGDHFLADESDIGFRIALKFGRQGVRAEKCGPDVHRTDIPQPARGGEHRSDERRGGKGWVSPFRSRWWPDH